MTDLKSDVLKMANDVIVAFLSKNVARPEEVTVLMRAVHATLVELAGRELSSPGPLPELGPIQTPAVSVATSVSPDFVACLECGRKFKSLRFHLTKHGLSPASYKAKWALDREYPLVAPNFAAKRSAFAHVSRFGRARKRKEKGQLFADPSGCGH